MRTFIKNSTLALAAVFALSACGKGPDAIVMEYAKANPVMDMAKAKAFVTPNSVEFIDLLAKLEASDKQLLTEAYKVIASCQCTISGETATCQTLDKDKKDLNYPVTLVKKDSKWMIDESKNIEMVKSMLASTEEQKAAQLEEAASKIAVDAINEAADEMETEAGEEE